MDSQLENSNLKRVHDEDNSDENKRKKLDVPEEVDSTTNFTDVNDDCLEHIFKHLKLKDLINVADTCKRFQASDQTIFAAKCKGKEIRLDPDDSNQMIPIILIGNTVEITEMTSCLKILRHFGVKISKLDIRYFRVGVGEKALLAWYMNEYCADSLINLEMHSATDEVTTNWTKPFTNVESVELWWCDMGDLSAWFPNVRRLMLHDSRCIKNTLPHLKKLEIGNGDSENFAEMLRLNQHLKILRLSGDDYDIKFIESISGYLQSVRFLDIECDSGFFNTEGGSIHLQSVNELHIDYFSFDPLPKIPFKFDRLEKVELTICHFNFNDNFKNFIMANSYLKEMKIYMKVSTPHSVEQIKADIAKLSPSLQVDIIVITEDDVPEEEDEEVEEDDI